MISSQTEYTEQVFRDLNLFQKELVSIIFDECTFIRCDFSEIVFSKCRFLNCKFKNCDLSLMKPKYCSFVNTGFEESKVIGVNWSDALSQTPKFSSPIEQFFKCIISHSTFIGLSLKKIRIKECFAKDVDFREAELIQADLTYTDFTESIFLNTNLTKADFTGARNYNINPLSNKIEKAKFSLPEAISLLYNLDIYLV